MYERYHFVGTSNALVSYVLRITIKKNNPDVRGGKNKPKQTHDDR